MMAISRPRRALAEAAAVVGRVLGPAASTVNPDVIVVGGAFGGGGYDLIADGLLAGLKETAFPAAFDAVTLRTGKRTQRAAALGAVSLILREGLTDYLFERIDHA